MMYKLLVISYNNNMKDIHHPTTRIILFKGLFLIKPTMIVVIINCISCCLSYFNSIFILSPIKILYETIV